MIGACSLQSADAAQLYITGSACLGLFSSIMDMSLYSVPSCSTSKWDPFFLRFCYCCFCSDIIFKSRKGPNGSLQRAWDDILPDRILIFCMYVNSLTFVTHIYAQPCLCLLSLFSPLDNWILQKKNFCRKHKIVRKLRTPEGTISSFLKPMNSMCRKRLKVHPWNKMSLRKSSCTTINPLPSKLKRLHRLRVTRTSAPVPAPSHSLQAPCSHNHIQALAVGSMLMTDHTPYNLCIS